MGQAIPRQHPAVVLRSHYAHLRTLLAVAMIAVVGLTAAVVILANERDDVSPATSAAPIESTSNGGVRYDGGPEEGTRGIISLQAPGVRYDGGPEEGTRDIGLTSAPSAQSDDGSQESPTRPGFSTD